MKQTDSVAATGYFKAPKANHEDYFGFALALSGDGATLAVGAPTEDSASTGTFAPGGMGYQAALGSADAGDSGAVTVYRRSTLTDTWAIEAFVKAPVAGSNDLFGAALALSEDGATLAVGAPSEDSASTGTFAPGGMGYQAALDSGGAFGSGAVTVYRRSDTDAWEIEAFVKASKTGLREKFGTALALSGDGATLAVGAPEEDSASTGTFTAPDGEGYQAALDSSGASDSGAVTVYRRSGSEWSVEAFVKAPVAGAFDEFGSTLALSADSSTLAVGARFEGSSHTGAFTAPDGEGYQAALDSDGAANSGAVTVYRLSPSGQWNIEAFVKAPKAGDDDQFGAALALSADGATLAVGARYEDSASTGTFTAPDGEGYQAALDEDIFYDDDGDDDTEEIGINAGAAYVYRRSGSEWSVEAFVKAPNAAAGDEFGLSLDLSSGGVVMAIGSSDEDSSFSGAFAPTDPGYQDALDSDGAATSGAAYIYRHPTGPGAWTAGNFVKAPKADAIDSFGGALALSDDGATLAVSATNEDGNELSQPVGGRSADTGDPMVDAGAVYLY